MRNTPKHKAVAQMNLAPRAPREAPAGRRAAADTAVAPEAIAPPSLRELLAKRLRKFVTVLPKALGEDNSEAIHDLRVASRRLQQVLVTMFPKPRSDQARRIVRVLQRARRAVGGWRDCDVLVELLERRIRRLRNPEERRAWETVHESVQERRANEIRRARRKLANHRLFTLAQDVARLTAPGPDQSDAGADGAGGIGAADALGQSISGGWQQWRDSMARAAETLDPPDLHAFRIQSKRLRYRIELARDLGALDCDPVLEFLRSLQDGLGQMHDRSECFRMAAEALASAKLLIREPRPASLLLRRMATEQEAEHAKATEIIAAAREGSQRVERWVQEYCAAEGAASRGGELAHPLSERNSAGG